MKYGRNIWQRRAEAEGFASEKELLVHLRYIEKLDGTQMAERFGIRRTTISKVLSRNGIRLSCDGSRPKKDLKPRKCSECGRTYQPYRGNQVTCERRKCKNALVEKSRVKRRQSTGEDWGDCERLLDPKPVPMSTEKRACKRCGKKLSAYNPNEYCFNCGMEVFE